MSHDSYPPADAAHVFEGGAWAEEEAVSRVAEGAPVEIERRFAIEVSGAAPMRCGDVQGFDDAEIAAIDALAPAPTRLAIVAPDEDTESWLERWAEDAEQVRRRLIIKRLDGAASDEGVTLVATIASFGRGVATSLSVESVRARCGEIQRSGVHSRAEIEAALKRWSERRDDERE